MNQIFDQLGFVTWSGAISICLNPRRSTTRRPSTPPRLPQADAGIRFHKTPIRRDRHRADDFPLAIVVIERDEGAFFARDGFVAGERVGEIGQADGDGAFEIGGAVGLEAEDEGQAEIRREWRGQSVRRDGSGADIPATGAVVAEEGIGRDGELGAGELGIGSEDLRREGDGGSLRGADGLQGPGADAGEVDDAGAGGGVVRLARDGFPLLANGGVVVACGPGAERGCAAINVDEEGAGGARAQGEAALGISGGAQGFLRAIHSDGDAWHGDGHPAGRDCGASNGSGSENLSGDTGSPDGSRGNSVEVQAEGATGKAIAIGIEGPSEQVGERGSVESDFEAGIGREGLLVEEGGFFPVGGNLHATDGTLASELGVELRGIQRGGEAEGDGEVKNSFPRKGDIALARGRGAEAHGAKGKLLGITGLEDFLDQLVPVSGVDGSVLVHVG